ncbi:MAG: hypothetical protein ACHQJ6_00015 [Candidatus Berkiellales bacterium]
MSQQSGPEVFIDKFYPILTAEGDDKAARYNQLNQDEKQLLLMFERYIERISQIEELEERLSRVETEIACRNDLFERSTPPKN